MLCRSIILLFSFAISLEFYGQDSSGCSTSEPGNIFFKKNSTRLTPKAKMKLDSLVTIFLSQPTCQILITGYSADLCDNCGTRSWDRSRKVFSYLIRKGISKERLDSTNSLEGNLNFVTLKLIPGSTLEKSLQPGLKNNYPE